MDTNVGGKSGVMKRLYNNINFKLILAISITGLFGWLLRIAIKELLDLDLLKDLYNYIAVWYSVTLVSFSYGIKDLIDCLSFSSVKDWVSSLSISRVKESVKLIFYQWKKPMTLNNVEEVKNVSTDKISEKYSRPNKPIVLKADNNQSLVPYGQSRGSNSGSNSGSNRVTSSSSNSGSNSGAVVSGVNNHSNISTSSVQGGQVTNRPFSPSRLTRPRDIGYDPNCPTLIKGPDGRIYPFRTYPAVTQQQTTDTITSSEEKLTPACSRPSSGVIIPVNNDSSNISSNTVRNNTTNPHQVIPVNDAAPISYETLLKALLDKTRISFFISHPALAGTIYPQVELLLQPYVPESALNYCFSEAAEKLSSCIEKFYLANPYVTIVTLGDLGIEEGTLIATMWYNMSDYEHLLQGLSPQAWAFMDKVVDGCNTTAWKNIVIHSIDGSVDPIGSEVLKSMVKFEMIKRINNLSY